MKILESHIIKTILVTLALFLTVGTLHSCKTNNGDIGPLYGIWAMDAMTIDGIEADVDLSLYYWRFQNNIVQITVKKPLSDFVNSSGTWSIEGDKLSLNFNHYNNNDDKLGGYTPPQELCLDRGITVAHIDALTDSKLVMNFIDKEGQTVKYTLRKLK